MGRRKIEIQPITHERNRSVTFLKRKNGLFKKAYELGVLCSVDVAVIIFDEKPGQHQKLYEYSSTDVRDIVKRHIRFTGEKDAKGPHDFSGGGGKADDLAEGDEDDEDEDDEAPSKPAAKRKSSGRGKGNNGNDAPPSPIDLDMNVDPADPSPVQGTPMTIPTPPLRGVSSADLSNLSLPISTDRHTNPNPNSSFLMNMASISRIRSSRAHMSMSPTGGTRSPTNLDDSRSHSHAHNQHTSLNALREGLVRGLPTRAEFDFQRGFHLGSTTPGFHQSSSMNPYNFSFMPTPTSPASTSPYTHTPTSFDILSGSAGMGVPTSLSIPVGIAPDSENFEARLMYQQMMLHQQHQQQQAAQQHLHHHRAQQQQQQQQQHSQQHQIGDLAAFLDAIDPPRGGSGTGPNRGNGGGGGNEFGTLRIDWPVHSHNHSSGSQGLSTTHPIPPGAPSSASSDPSTSWLDFLSGTASRGVIDPSSASSISWERGGNGSGGSGNLNAASLDLAEVLSGVGAGGGSGEGGGSNAPNRAGSASGTGDEPMSIGLGVNLSSNVSGGGGSGSGRSRKRPRVEPDSPESVEADMEVEVEKSDSGSEYEPFSGGGSASGGKSKKGGGGSKVKEKMKEKDKSERERDKNGHGHGRGRVKGG